jgi:hypothetical protein
MNQESTTTPTQTETPLEAAHRHIGLAHYRLATAEGIPPELAAACIDELNAAMDALEPLLPPLPRRESGAKRHREPAR